MVINVTKLYAGGDILKYLRAYTNRSDFDIEDIDIESIVDIINIPESMQIQLEFKNEN